jgi:hypothetical protein
MMRRLLVLLSVALLSACVPTVPAEKLANIKTIGIISAIGDRAAFESVGITVFGNDSKTIPINEWGIDPLVISTLSKTLGNRYQIVPVAYDVAAFQPERIYRGGVFKGDRQSIADIVRAAAAPQGLDAYIVVTKVDTGYGESGQLLRGLGLARGPGPLFSYKVYVHALYTVTVVDGHQFAEIGRGGPAGGGFGWTANPVHGPSVEMSEAAWAKTDVLPNRQQIQQLKPALEGMLVDTLPGALQMTGLR